MKKLENVAIVYDKVTKFGGAERVLMALNEIWPEAPIFTTIHKPDDASWSQNIKVIPSFLNSIPFVNNHPELLSGMAPIAFEQFDFSGYDAVLSVTSSDAKAVITSPHTMHVCYCLTPTRYLWSGYFTYLKEPGFGFLNNFARIMMKHSFHQLRFGDYIYSRRPDYFLAISDVVKKRISSYYRMTSYVLYPPADSQIFTPGNHSHNGEYYLIVSRLVPYKKIDYVIRAFRLHPKRRLIIVGKGLDGKRLKGIAADNIEFINELTDIKLRDYYLKCKALIFPGEEDFGITSVEAQLCGKPVIAYGGGGTRESIIVNKTGLLYNITNEESLNSALDVFENKCKFSQNACRKNGLNFSKMKFKSEMQNFMDIYWQKFQSEK